MVHGIKHMLGMWFTTISHRLGPITKFNKVIFKKFRVSFILHTEKFVVFLNSFDLPKKLQSCSPKNSTNKISNSYNRKNNPVSLFVCF